MTSSRRDFIRTLGTGAVIVAAGSAGLAGCDAMPDRAVEAWNGPAAGLTDVRLKALSYALLAPNPHNMQAWLVDMRTPGSVALFVDRTRLLPMTDPYSRQVMIGQGTFLELLSMAAAAAGHRTDIALFPAGAYSSTEISDQPVAQVRFTADTGVARDPLFAQILRRRTTRGQYDDRALEQAHVATLTTAHRAPQVRLDMIHEGATLDGVRTIAADAFTCEMTTLRTLKETVDRSRVGEKEILAHRDGLSFDGPFFWWARTLGVFTPEAALTPGSFAYNSAVDMGRTWSQSAAAYGVMTTDDNTRTAQILAGRAFVRAHLAATALGLALQPMSQALEEYPEMAPHRAKLLALLGTPPGHTIQMLYRLGYAASDGPAPRRPLKDLLIP